MNRTVSVSKHEAEVRRITNPPGESDSSAKTRVRISNPMTNPIRHPKHEARKSPGVLPCRSRLTFPPYTAGFHFPGQMPVSMSDRKKSCLNSRARVVFKVDLRTKF